VEFCATSLKKFRFDFNKVMKTAASLRISDFCYNIMFYLTYIQNEYSILFFLFTAKKGVVNW